MADRNEQILTPSQLNSLARDLLEGSFPLVWVEAELSSVTRPSSGHLYFTLKDARAQIRCAMFKPKSTWLKFQPREGLRVLARGRLTLYEARGDYQLVLDHLEEAGEGALRRDFDELRARLAAEGLFDAERKQALPAHVQRLAVITSPSGAAVRDVLSVLARRFPLLEVDLLPSLVQGDSAAAQITSLLQRADASGRYDVILITRGGGSLEDLWAFNDERLARAIAAAQTPVVSAVGHETDFSLSDFVADVRAPTPSVAAELLVPDQRELLARVRRAQARMTQLQQHALGNAMQRADRLALRLRAQSPQARLQLLHRRQEEAGRQLRARMMHVLERLQARVQRGQTQLQSHNPQRHLAGLQQRLRALHPQAAMQRRLQHDQLQLRSIARSLEAVSPLATVARGYAIVTRPADGSVVRSAAEVVTGERLRAQLADGSIQVRVESGES
ncbi:MULTISPECIES: exodeoxyribonuclease VII large subunit [Xanthomonas]|uniref:Exodeoxyribonuclease 7 large subunit n=1 Tax=Xanthomonas phaseoli pv. dieffenbachiae TaxID=92828 RepID=A0A1V9HGE5_9XANT|nr:exodeoxyribonuclease VII large subunit [Xanthomonas phaseoli]MBO9767421.1 exodeoxyribonuclease VII large subunit [Xanthomonas phaseoli pv. dieffenbachiae]MBO9777525.1 exodeoxyribonuclease VII large subunit [Xanthomonas phaseoli pv. dieffenbachiae]MBO9780921.1 exodeoxyribonuclease VII large subunit [Xanthomonas phaseoli pv. dieffenbachiae]MBO9788882.1 exodeoxyribonuclease VII large subunit [Xanthomonas phaseoli pv. dieffenbachiae]MBO9796854.1 exodeoxyribonuclease VII large subunit [Xanthomon